MFNKLAASIVALGITIGCAATAAPVSDENAVVPAGVGIVAGTCASTGPGTINGCNGIYNNGVPVAGGLTVPTAPLIGGTGTALAPINLGTNLSITGGTLNASGGASPGGTTGQIQTNNGSGGLGALPTNTTGASVVLQTTSGGTVAPAVLPLATTSALGAIKPDGTTITVNGSGVASAVGGAATSVTVGTTSVGAGTPGAFLSVSGSTLGNVSPTGTGSVVLGTSPTIATPTMTGTATTAGINDTSAGGGASVGGGLGITSTGDLSSNQTIANWAAATTDHKSQNLTTTIGTTGTATHVWENFDPQVVLNGTTTGEINVMHSLLNIGSTGSMVNGEALEAEYNNAGTTTGTIQSVLAIGINSGTMSTAVGYQNTLTNNGSITTYEQFSCSAVAGNAPTNDYCLRNSDPNATIDSLGHVLIGVVGTASATQVVKIVGPDALSGTYPLVITATGGLGNLLLLNDAGTLSIGQNINIGTNGTQLGSLAFESDTSGSIKITAPTGALTTYNLVLPAAPPSANGDVLAFTTAGVGSFVANGSGGSGCVPAGSANQILLDTGSGTCSDSTLTLSGSAFTGPSGATATAISVTGSTATNASAAGGAIQFTGGAGGTNGVGGAYTVAAGAGSATNAAGGVASQTGGAGAGTGAGGNSDVIGGASGTGATGNGGAAIITGGAATSTNGTGGATFATGGVGTGTGSGGAANMTGGVSGATGAAGQINISGGAGASGSTVGGATVNIFGGASGTGATGNGGGIILTGGTALSTNGNGGSSFVKGGVGVGTGVSGTANVVGGASDGTGAAGSGTVTGGAGSGTVGGATATLTGGASGAGATGNGGAASVLGGAAVSTNGAGGQANMTGGVGIGTGAGGNVVLTPGAAGASGAVGVIKAAGLFELTSGTPTIASGACGTGTNGTISGTDQTNVITIGAVATTACAVSFGGGVAGTYPTAPKACLFAAGNAAAAASTVLPFISAISATGFTLSGSVLASTVFEVHCF